MELKDYEKWCKENGKDAMNEDTLKEFKKALEEKEKEIDLEKLNKVARVIAEYFDDEFEFEERDDFVKDAVNHLNAWLGACKMNRLLNEMVDEFGKSVERNK